MNKELLITQEGLEKLKIELKDLKERARKEVIERIRNAKEFGDLSENAEYEDAKNQQSFVEGRIQELEEMIRHARIVSHGSAHHKTNVEIGDKVTIKCDGDSAETYEIVGATESDPAQGKISSESPIARTLIGRKKGENVEIPTPDGAMACKILKIE